MKKWILGVVVFLAFVAQMIVVVPSGSRYCSGDQCGIFYWGAHEHDGIWHLALGETSFKSFPPKMPNYSGESLKGYNALLDYAIFVINYVSKIPIPILYFKIIPIAWFGLMIYTWTRFAKSYTSNKYYILWLIFFLFFGNSLSYLLRFFHEGHFNGGSGLLSMQPPQMLTNIQFALSLPMLAMALQIYKKKTGSLKDGVFLALLSFFMMALKFYGGVILLIMSVTYVWLQHQVWGSKKIIAYLTMIMLAFGLSTLIFYNPLAAAEQEPILRFSPMTTVRPIIEEISLVYLPQVAAARNNLLTQGIGIKLLVIEVATLMVFVILNFGTRLIGIATWSRQIKKDNFHLVTLVGALAGLLLNVFFVQRGEWWNTVQFLYYSMILLSIYSAEWMANWSIKKGQLKLVIVAVIVLLTIPNALDTIKIFTHFPPGSYISDDETRALGQLKEMENGTILALPITPKKDSTTTPAPLYDRYETSYVSAYTGMPTYLNDLVQLRLTAINYEDRQAKINSFECSILEEVKYVYTPTPELVQGWENCESKLEKVIEEGQTRVYQVKR